MSKQKSISIKTKRTIARLFASLRELFEFKSFFRNLFIPLTLLVLYFAFYSWLVSREFESGINIVFATRMWKYLLALLVFLILTFLIVMLFTKNQRISIEGRYEKITWSDLVYVLFPLTPVIQYIVENQSILSLRESVSIILFFAGFSIILIYLIPALVGRISSTRILMALGLAFSYTLIIMPVLSKQFLWSDYGSLKIQLPVFAGIFMIPYLLDRLKIKWVFQIFIVSAFAITCITQFSALAKKQASITAALPFSSNNLYQTLSDRKLPLKPNIYIMIYDSYLPDETLRALGIDNSSQEASLQDLGFTIYPHVYSIGPHTISSMSRVFNASTDYYGDERTGLSGNGMVHDLFKRFGYTTYGIFPTDYEVAGVDSGYDILVPRYATSKANVLISAIVAGNFRPNFELSTMTKLTYDQYLDEKIEILANLPNSKALVYSHTYVPNHSVSMGLCKPNDVDLYREHLTWANDEMDSDLQAILANDPNALVVIAGDHGPWLTKTCWKTGGIVDIAQIDRLDIQNRYATFLAIRWPDGSHQPVEDIRVLQDLFPAIFAHLFNDADILQFNKVEPVTLDVDFVSGAYVVDGVIHGGMDDGQPLFITEPLETK